MHLYFSLAKSSFLCLKKVAENVQAIPQSHTKNQHMASQGIIASEQYQS